MVGLGDLIDYFFISLRIFFKGNSAHKVNNTVLLLLLLLVSVRIFYIDYIPYLWFDKGL